jgi:hypothetical protein
MTVMLQKNTERTKRLIKIIIKTIEHSKGTKKMKEQEMYDGFSKEKHREYEKQIIERFGALGKAHIAESKKNVKSWTKEQWDRSKTEFDEICNELTVLLEKKFKADSKEVQTVICRHFQWLNKFWTPTKQSYLAHAQYILDSDLRKAYEFYSPELPEFTSEAIRYFADFELM